MTALLIFHLPCLDFKEITMKIKLFYLTIIMNKIMQVSVWKLSTGTIIFYLSGYYVFLFFFIIRLKY